VADKADLIVVIYDAIIDPSRWDEVVRCIIEDPNYFSGILVLQQPGAGGLTALSNVDPVSADAYAQTYHKHDPLKTPERSIAPGEVRFCSRKFIGIVDEAVLTSPALGDFLKSWLAYHEKKYDAAFLEF
jgi:hypothetical protein